MVRRRGLFCQWISLLNEKEVCLFSEGQEKNAERVSFYFFHHRERVNREACKTTKNKILLANGNRHIWKSGCVAPEMVSGKGAPPIGGPLEERSLMLMGNLQKS